MKLAQPQSRLPMIIGAFMVFCLLGIKVSHQPFLSSLEGRLEWLAYDLRLRNTLPDTRELDQRIVIVDVDEKSLAAEGRWPWSRDKLAQMVDILMAKGVAVIGFDIVFAEEQRNIASEVANAIKQQDLDIDPDVLSAIRNIAPSVDHDTGLARSIEDNPVVLAYFFTPRPGNSKGKKPPHILELPAEQVDQFVVPVMGSYTANIQAIQDKATSAGFFIVKPDDDGIVRRASLVMQHNNYIYPSLALEVARTYLGFADIHIQAADIGDYLAVESIQIGDYFSAPTDPEGRVVIPYKGQKGSFQYLSATDVLKKNISNIDLSGTIVLIGTTAEGLYDLRSTPVSSVFPGIEIHANVISGILDNSLPYAPTWAEGIDLATIILLGLLLAFLFPLLSALPTVITTFALIATMISINTWLWASHGLVLSIALPVLMVFILASINLAYGYLFESKGRKQLKNMFGQYVPPDLVEEMYEHPEETFGFEGESREMTVLFADIRSFTTISESLPANELKKLLNFFFTPMTQIIFDSRGTIDKYVGDMIMAFWGAPLPDADHRSHAIGAALDMLKRVNEIRPQLSDKNWPEINIGVGLNTGLMNVGDMGSEFRRSYTVIGDAVNLGSRLEGLTKFYGVGLIVSEFTREGVNDFIFRKLDMVKVKGKNEAVTIYEPVCLVDEADDSLRSELKEYHSALDAYYEQRWNEAETLFDTLRSQYSDRKIYSLYLERISDLQTSGVPDDWDGVYTHTSK